MQLYGFLQQTPLVKSRGICPNTKKRSAAPHTSQTFLKSSNNDFVEKVTKAFLSADIPLYKPINDNGHSLLSETICRKIVLQLRVDELKWIRNAVYKFFSFFFIGAYMLYTVINFALCRVVLVQNH